MFILRSPESESNSDRFRKVVFWRKALNLLAPLLLVILLALIPTIPASLQAQNLKQQGCDLLDQAMLQVEQIRGLSYKHSVVCRALARDEFHSLSNDYLFELISPDDFHLQGHLYKALGLIPEEYDYDHCYLKNSNDYTEAFYHIFRKEIIIPADTPVDFNLMAHELVHALQDQHFDLSRLAKVAVESTDASLGIGALIEGDAMKVQATIEQGLAGVVQEKQIRSELETQTCKLPAALQALFYFPYSFGHLFVDRLFGEEKSYKAVNKAFYNLPVSSTEILHKDAYGNFKVSMPIVSKSVLQQVFGVSGSSQLLFQDTIGQYGIRIILGNYLPVQLAILAGKGWQGDSARVFQLGQKRIIQWDSEWVSEVDASEFYIAFLSSLAQRTGSTFYQESNRVLSQFPNGPAFYLERKSKRVLFGMFE